MPNEEPDRGQRAGRAMTVAALNELGRRLLEAGPRALWVAGEVSDLVRSAVGHLYFTLGDGRAQVKCVMFKTDVTEVARGLAPGTRVEVRGGLTLFEPRGTYQLQVTDVLEAGLGARAQEIARVKKRLAADGLLDPARKRPLPRFPATIGVVTSRDGAAWRDVLKVALDRFPARLVLAHALVQGTDAPEQIVRALGEVQRLRNLSVVVLARGGGATEDLAAFDDERVARAVAACRVPIVTGVGHEIDVTLADLVADVRAATPSNAAELAVPTRKAIREHLADELRALQRALARTVGEARLEVARHDRALTDPRRLLRPWRSELVRLDRGLEPAMRRTLADDRRVLQALTARLAQLEPRARLARDRHAIDARRERLTGLVERHILRAREALARQGRALHALSPLSVLERGYAIATIEESGRAVRDPREAPPGTALVVRVAHGSLRARAE